MGGRHDNTWMRRRLTKIPYEPFFRELMPSQNVTLLSGSEVIQQWWYRSIVSHLYACLKQYVWSSTSITIHLVKALPHPCMVILVQHNERIGWWSKFNTMKGLVGDPSSTLWKDWLVIQVQHYERIGWWSKFNTMKGLVGLRTWKEFLKAIKQRCSSYLKQKYTSPYKINVAKNAIVAS
jgi:tellurite resistance-related uncharacterized protein